MSCDKKIVFLSGKIAYFSYETLCKGQYKPNCGNKKESRSYERLSVNLLSYNKLLAFGE